MKKYTKKCKSLLQNYRALATIAAALSLAVFTLSAGRSDADLRNHAVKLLGRKGGACSGVQVKAPSGTDYILTAAHCRVLIDAGSIIAVTEDGGKLERRVVAEDPASDLMLLEGLPNMQGLPVAKELAKHEHIRTFTHGGALDTYRTEGTVIQILRIKVLIDIILAPEQEAACVGPKYKVEEVETLFGMVKVCLMDVEEMVSTVMTIPGSSGGMLVNDSGEVAGIVSAGDGKLSFFVKLSDIQLFLTAY